MTVIDEIIFKFLNKKLNSDFERINQDKANFIELYYLIMESIGAVSWSQLDMETDCVY